MSEAYAFVYNNKEVLKNSSSGGAFSAISDYFLNHNGVVYGAIYNYEQNIVVHSRAENKEQRDVMRGSKYLQSALNETYRSVMCDLNNDQEVLFTGTLCQVAGLKRFLQEKKCSCEKLITCDIICHGVTSPLIWKDYINYKAKIKIKSVNFREKSNGWTNSRALAETDNGQIDLGEYMRLFYSHTIMRPSCHNCQYSSINRCSEITIGDFWGIETLKPAFDYKDGVSFVLANNENGINVFKKIVERNDEIISVGCGIEDVNQPNFYHPTNQSVIRERFWKDYKKKHISYIVKKYASNSFVYSKIVFVQKVIDTVRSR